MGEIRRPSPEHFLKQAEAEERRRLRGRLKIFLGYASGVGKSQRMFDEGRRRKTRGQDVVVAAGQDASPEEFAALVNPLEVIPSRVANGTPAVDLDAVLRRHPGVCLIDGLAYKNPPGSKHPERWQDVEELLAAGISVITSVNLQFVKEKQREIERIRGKVWTDAVPEAFLRTADEIELVDAPAEYCAERQQESGRSPREAAALEHELSQLREIALMLAAQVVDHQLEEYLRDQGIEHSYGTHERILVCMTPRSNARLMLQRGRRQADLFHGELYAVYVEQDDLKPEDKKILEQNLTDAREAGAHVETLQAEDAVSAVLRFAGRHGITQIFAGHSQRGGFLSRWRQNFVERMILEAEGIDIRVFPHSEVIPYGEAGYVGS
jgi:two-component system sensor histidine kinase KdpD